MTKSVSTRFICWINAKDVGGKRENRISVYNPGHPLLRFYFRLLLEL